MRTIIWLFLLCLFALSVAGAQTPPPGRQIDCRQLDCYGQINVTPQPTLPCDPCGANTATVTKTPTITVTPTITPTLTIGECYNLSAIGAPNGTFLCINGVGEDRLILGPNVDPTDPGFAPGGILQLGLTANSQARMGLFSASNSPSQPNILAGMKGRGTVLAPTTSQDNDEIFNFFAMGYDAVNVPRISSGIVFDVDGSPVSGAVPGGVKIFVVDTGSVSRDAIIANSSGHVGVGGGGIALDPPLQLYIGGSTGYGFNAEPIGTGVTQKDDWNLRNSTVLLINGADSDFTVTGFHATSDPPTAGQLLVFLNSSGFTATFSNENIASTASQRIHTTTGQDIVVPNGGSVMFFYDDSDVLNGIDRWRDVGLRDGYVTPTPGPPTSTPLPTYTGLPCDPCVVTNTITPTFTITPTPTTPSCGGDPCTSAVDWTRLQTYPSACSAGSFVSTLADVPTCTSNASTASALAANPTDCSANNYATTIDAGGNLTCSQVSLTAGVTGVLPIANGGTNQSGTLTAGSVLFSDGGKVTQDNSNFFWDDTNNRFSIGTNGPLATFHVAGGFTSVNWADAVTRNTQAYFRKDFVESDLPTTLSGLFGVDYLFTAAANTSLNVNAALLSITLAGTKNYSGIHRGFLAQTAGTGSGTVSGGIVGAMGRILTSNGSSQAFTSSTGIIGLEGSIQHQGSGTITKGVAVHAVNSTSTGTITDAVGFAMDDASGGGTVTNQTALLIPNLTKGATSNIGINNGSRTVFAPPAAQNITAAATTLAASGTVLMLTANNSYTISNAPTIADGQADGQFLIIINVDTTDTITLQDQGTLASSNLRLSANTIALGPRDSIMLLYSSTVGDWVQIGQTNVL